MPTLTNKFSYPDSIVRAVENDTYNRGDSDFTATELIGPSRIRTLVKQYKNEITYDVDDRLFILQGQLMHALLEKAGTAIDVIERRFFADIDGYKVSAQIDCLSIENDTLMDWKNSTVWSCKKGTKAKNDWVAQLNIQLELLRRNGLDAKKLQIWVMCRDWRPGEAAKEKDRYPNKAAYHDIPVWSRENTVNYIKSRIKAHRDAEVTLPECTSDEHWGWRRCAGYCEVAKFCNQYKGYKQHLKESETL